jgi:hypothetical protein
MQVNKISELYGKFKGFEFEVENNISSPNKLQ